ncbi:MAG: IS1634 family transposase [Bacillota bacterium]|nr:IS1634 family transposase [Bacillota bacterium]
MARKSKKQKARPKRNRGPVKRKYAHFEVEERRRTIPLILALANKILETIGFVDFINASVEWDDEQCKVTPGHLAKAVILATFFDIRAPLSLIKGRFIGIDTEFFFGEGITAKDLNDYAVGRTLDKIAEANPDRLFSTICLSTYAIYKIAFKRLHSDTTSLSFYGEYDPEISEEEAEEVLQIVRGYNKDHRPECKQVVVGKVVNEHGMPLVSLSMDGNTSDVEWNQKALELVGQLYADQLAEGIYVADAKLMTINLFRTLMNPDYLIRFVSRCPANFGGKLEEKTVAEAYADGEAWVELGTFGSGKKACSYKGKAYTKAVDNREVQLIVLCSSEGESRFQTKKEKARQALEQDIANTNKKVFVCEADAQEEWKRFCKSHKKSLYLYDVTFVETTQEKRPRGNPGKNPKAPQIINQWSLQIQVSGEDPTAMAKFRHAEECFVLITNVSPEEFDMREVLGIYKNQMVVEIDFRLLKEPCVASVIYLKTPERIQSLAMLLHVSLLVRAMIQYKLRKGIKEYPADKLPRVGRDGRKIQQNITTRFLIEEFRHQGFIENEAGTYQLIFINQFRRLQMTTFLEFLGMTVEELIEY